MGDPLGGELMAFLLPASPTAAANHSKMNTIQKRATLHTIKQSISVLKYKVSTLGTVQYLCKWYTPFFIIKRTASSRYISVSFVTIVVS